MWIIEEVILSKKAKAFCRPFSIDFDKLYLACQKMTRSRFFPFSARSRRLTYLGDWKYKEIDEFDRENAFDLKVFIDSRDKAPTDLQDKVYALRGIVNRLFQRSLGLITMILLRGNTDLAKRLLTAQLVWGRTTSIFQLYTYHR